MPAIKFQHIVSCSSEDRNNPADNLLKPEGSHKWKCSTAGEKSVSVVIQLEKASQIHSMDIGNEGSAFVEVLVGRSSATSDQDYQVLLVASSFLTPMEARNGTNRTSVRMFDISKLSAPAAKEKWDRVKIVCSQPFNKTSTYGLSFIKLHSPPEAGDTQEPKQLGFFKLKDDGNGHVKTGTMFSHRGKLEAPSTPVTGAAAARAASRLADTAGGSSTPKPITPKPSPAAASSSSTGKQESKTTPSQTEKRKHAVSDDDTDEETEKPTLRKQSTSLSSVASRGSNHSEKQPPLKKTKSEPPKESPKREFGHLMDRVVFVLSGFQNPFRGELRDRALAMGAKYRGDWGKDCTHLVCAFPKTPKYNQVKGKGRIVDKKWIADCYKQKKLLPWRDYRLGDADSPDEDSEEEIRTKTPAKQPKAKPTPKRKDSTPPPLPAVSDSDEEMYGGATDSGEDTEDEIRKMKEKEAGKKGGPSKKSPVKPTTDDPYGVETDEDEPGPSKSGADSDSADSGLPELPDFLQDKNFFIYGSMDATERKLMHRYIVAYGGELEDYMSDKVNYVVSSAKWDNNFDDALSDNPNLVFVKPKWVHVCHDKQKLVPHQPYIVVPDA